MNQFYVTKEIAEKLRVKGYDREYDVTDEWVDGLFYQVEDGTFFLPRIDEVLAWLRDEKRIHVMPDIYYDGWDTIIYTDIHTNDIGDYVYNVIDRGDLARSTYEETILDSIEYILDNLIQ